MKKFDHHPFENQIFDHYRKQSVKIREAISLLRMNGYTIYEKSSEVYDAQN